MQTQRDWAEFYREKRLWIYPYNLKEEDWVYWKKIKSDEEYRQMYNQWDWNVAIGIKLVVGKKSVRVIEVTNKQLLKKALTLLGLPKDYAWIIYSQARYGIVVDVPNVSNKLKGMRNKSFKQVLLLWEGYYALPSTGIPRYFYNNQTPQNHPKQVKDEVFLDCIDRLIQ